jgi:glutamine amidotransferase-like uncharacterized protein/uncharacterized lipoprotein YddW (UPF0748 family)
MKRLYTLASLFFLLFIVSSRAQTERGIYVWPVSFYEMGGVDSAFNLLQKNEITDVFLLVKGEAGYSFFPSAYTIKDHFSAVYDTSRNIIEKEKAAKQAAFFSDPGLLQSIIDKAHSLKMRIHAWFIISGDRRYVEDHPGSEVVRIPDPSKDKHPYPVTDKGHVNLANPLYKDYIFSQINKALTYPFDGLMLDKIRYTSMVYSWDEIHISKAIRAGININNVYECAVNSNYGNEDQKEDFYYRYRDNDKDIREWIKLKKADIEDYVKEAHKLTRDKKITLSASFMPEGAYDEDFADVNYAQNFSELSPYLDYIVIMAYPKSFSMPETWIKMVAANAKAKSSCKIWTAIQAYDTISADFIYKQVINTRLAESDGIALFRLGGLSDEMWQAFRSGMEEDIESSMSSQLKGILYSGGGTIRNCWLKSAKATFNSDSIITYLYKEKALSDFNTFADKSFLIIPGGGCSDEAKALDTTGLKNIENFVSTGGGYIGICAGAYLPGKGYNNLTEKFQIVNAEAEDIQHWNRGSGKVNLNITASRHPVFAGIKGKEFELSYFNGPVLIPSDLKLPGYKQLAVFKTDFHENGAIPDLMLNKTAILESKFKKGKIILFSPHPELTAGKEFLLLNTIKYVSE